MSLDTTTKSKLKIAISENCTTNDHGILKKKRTNWLLFVILEYLFYSDYFVLHSLLYKISLHLKILTSRYISRFSRLVTSQDSHVSLHLKILTSRYIARFSRLATSQDSHVSLHLKILTSRYISRFSRLVTSQDFHVSLHLKILTSRYISRFSRLVTSQERRDSVIQYFCQALQVYYFLYLNVNGR